MSFVLRFYRLLIFDKIYNIKEKKRIVLDHCREGGMVHIYIYVRSLVGVGVAATCIGDARIVT